MAYIYQEILPKYYIKNGKIYETRTNKEVKDVK